MGVRLPPKALWVRLSPSVASCAGRTAPPLINKEALQRQSIPECEMSKEAMGYTYLGANQLQKMGQFHAYWFCKPAAIRRQKNNTDQNTEWRREPADLYSVMESFLLYKHMWLCGRSIENHRITSTESLGGWGCTHNSPVVQRILWTRFCTTLQHYRRVFPQIRHAHL